LSVQVSAGLKAKFCVRAAFSPCNGVFAGEGWP
jgi:hypothetical protein